MARLFDDASSQYLDNANAIVSGAPLTMACWFNLNDIILPQVLMSICDTGGTGHRYQIYGGGAPEGRAIIWQARDAGVGSALSTTSYTANTWYHACGIDAATNSRKAYINGGSVGTNTTVISPTGLDTAYIGTRYSTSLGVFISGLIAEAGIWNVALIAEEVAALAKGISPLLIRPENLVAYWPLIGRTNPEIDIVGGFNMTVTGATVSDHCRVLGPYKMPVPYVYAAAIGGLSIPVAMHHYQHNIRI